MKRFDEFLNERRLAAMTPTELRKRVLNNFEATPTRLEELVDTTKDWTTGEQMSIAYALGVTACGLYCNLMEQKYNIRIPI
jgi:hypothetical protein